MPAGIEITNTGHTAVEIRALARKRKNRAAARRLEAIARVMEGARSRGEVARQAKWPGRRYAAGSTGTMPWVWPG